MAKYDLREKAIEMRKKGMSYSAIKEEIAVSKGTLSVWLREMPLTRERINELRGWSERRIERCRETKARKKEARFLDVYKKVAEQIGSLSDRELFIGGILLYWAEGTKAKGGAIHMTNTDPAMLIFFLRWLEHVGIDRSRIRGRLHLYSDMDVQTETIFWAETLGLSKEIFRKPYIKDSLTNRRQNYKGRFGHGTCDLYVNDVSRYEKLTAAIHYVRSAYGGASL